MSYMIRLWKKDLSFRMFCFMSNDHEIIVLNAGGDLEVQSVHDLGGV